MASLDAAVAWHIGAARPESTAARPIPVTPIAARDELISVRGAPGPVRACL